MLKIKPRERAMEEAIANGLLMENGQKNGQRKSQKQPNLSVSNEKQTQKQPKKQPKLKIPEFPSKIVENVYKAIKLNRKAKYSWLADDLGNAL